MKASLILAISFFALFTFSALSASAQVERQQRMEELFVMYIETALTLNTQESAAMRPLIHNYLTEVKEINKKIEDPLLKEQQRVDLKMQFRNKIKPILGEDRSIRFFAAEQDFRRRIRDELNRRRGKKKF